MSGIADTFNRADSSSTINPASDGGTWTVGSGFTWGIASNQAQRVDSFGNSVVWRPSVADGFAQVTVTGATSSGYGGLIFRLQDASNFWVARCEPGGTNFSDVSKYVAGSRTGVASFTHTDGDVMRVEFSGSSIVVKRNGATVATITDSTFSTQTNVGLYATGSNQSTLRFDDFTSDVLPSAPARTPWRPIVRLAAVRRAAVI